MVQIHDDGGGGEDDGGRSSFQVWFYLMTGGDVIGSAHQNKNAV